MKTNLTSRKDVTWTLILFLRMPDGEGLTGPGPGKSSSGPASAAKLASHSEYVEAQSTVVSPICWGSRASSVCCPWAACQASRSQPGMNPTLGKQTTLYNFILNNILKLEGLVKELQLTGSWIYVFKHLAILIQMPPLGPTHVLHVFPIYEEEQRNAKSA